MKNKIIQAICNLKPNCGFMVFGETYESIQWMSDEEIPSKNQVLTEIARIESLAKQPTADENKATASQLLSDSDWIENPSVSDTSNTPHLTNTDALIAWRVAVRAIAVNPTAGDIAWPVQPATIWSE